MGLSLLVASTFAEDIINVYSACSGLIGFSSVVADDDEEDYDT